MYTSSITVDQVIDALADFLQPIVPGAEIVRAQVNRVPMPSNPGIVLTELINTDLAMPATDYQPDDGTATVQARDRFDVQIDFYGAQAGEFCAVAKAMLRSHWGFSHFPANIKPLYTSDGIQAPLVTGEQQYESRWTLTASLQYNPIVTVPQDFADVLVPNKILPADVVAP